ncbi:LytTR family DNA-binding domain-containing protein [Hymenobacter sp. GOD-10R]|uniref:LytR/AlgR family response regulator transcription factor n=1 Tax=Hymenobacter sp. GOD-10R TaxID=3093922 RepID=UPI002D79504C|nr:LytTR family DNA-binding domain-containing protein [Hymenobacter sp. GOD-10R]WRQ27721.1 LytTR family DNA-binding domain-containing protein [Hymenobacter sp. GOD-10R]
MKILIVEDEEMAVKKLTKTLTAVEPDAEVVGVAGSIRETVAWLKAHPAPELILMDIELADGQSFQIFEETEVRSTVVFTTSYDEYAIKAFKVNSIDYLLKPIQKEDLRAALDKFSQVKSLYRGHDAAPEPALNVSSLIRELQQLQPKEYRQRFLVQYAQKLVSVETHQIAYFYSDERLNLFKTTDGKKMVVDYSLDELEAMLDPARFFRISRSFLVSIDSVEQIEPYFGNRLALHLRPSLDKEVIVSREKLTPFKTWMGK